MSSKSDDPAHTDADDHAQELSPTSSSDLLDRLSPSQIAALDALLQGVTDSEAAETAGVDRTTVSRWKNHNPEFIAAFNRAKQDEARRLRHRRHRLKRKALQKVEEGVEEGDPEMIELAVTEVRAEELDDPGPTDAATVLVNRQSQRAIREEHARVTYATAMLSRLFGNIERSTIAQALRAIEEDADAGERARKLLYAAERMDETADETPFDMAAPELVWPYYKDAMADAEIDDQRAKNTLYEKRPAMPEEPKGSSGSREEATSYGELVHELKELKEEIEDRAAAPQEAQ